ncbi:MAG: PKD domain-containing protein [Brachybacterium sp.]
MATKTASFVRGRRIRVTRVDGCGRPVYGEDSQAVSKGFISVAFTANTVESDEINQPNASGETCIYEPSVPSLSGYGVEITFCEVDPELFSLITGQEVYLNGDGDVIGLTVGTDIDMADQGFALELWAGSPTGDACANPGSGATGSFGYFLMPYLKGGMVGDFTVENGAVTFTITGATTRDNNLWGVGPYDVMLTSGEAAPLSTPLAPRKHVLLIVTGVAPPEPFVGARPLMDPDNTEITGITAVEGASPTEADLTLTGAVAGEPVWVEFGDGTWDYVEDGSTGTTHAYDENGTYTVRANSNGTWIEETIEIPVAP